MAFTFRKGFMAWLQETRTKAFQEIYLIGPTEKSSCPPQMSCIVSLL